MYNNFFNEVKNRQGFFYIFVIFMSVIAKSNKTVFIFKDSFLSNYGSSDIPYHIINDILRRGNFGIGINIKAVILNFVKDIY